MDGGETFKTKPRPRSSYSLITLTSQTTQIINYEESEIGVNKEICSSIVPRPRPITHSRRSPFLKQRLASINMNFSQSGSADVINSEDMFERNYCDEVLLLREKKYQVISAKIYINETKHVNTSSLWYSGFIEIINDKLNLTKVNKNISKAEKFPSTNIPLIITPQLVLASLQRYYVCKYGTKIGFEIGIRKSLNKDTQTDVTDHEKSPLVRIAFNQYSTAQNFHKYLMSKIIFSKCSHYYMFHELSLGELVSDPSKDHTIIFEVNSEILLNMSASNGIKSNKGFINIGCCLSNKSNYRKPIYGYLETVGFDELDLKLIRSHRNYRKTSYNDAYNNQMHFILPKRLNKICLLKYSFKNRNLPLISIKGNMVIRNSRNIKIKVGLTVNYSYRSYKDIKKLVLSLYLPSSLCNLFLVKNGYSNNFLTVKENKKFVSNNSGTSKICISKGFAYYDEISSSIKWIFDFENLFERKDPFTSFMSLLTGKNTCKNVLLYENIEEQLECSIHAPFDVVLSENKEPNIQLEYIFDSTDNGLSNVITSTNYPLAIQKATIHYVENDEKVYLPNIHIKYTQTISAFYQVNIKKENV